MTTSTTTKASVFTAWWDTYRASTTQLCALDIAVRWCQLRVPATEAAAWARLGYLPDKAATLIAAGITPAMAREMEKRAGGRDELAAERVQQMIATGQIIDPADVIRVQDPTGRDQ